MEKDDGDALLSTPHQLLGMVDDDFAGLERRLMEALQHVHETGLIRPSDIQLPILSSPPTVTQSIPGYEGGELDPQTLGVACIGLPPSEGRGANKEGAAYNLNPVRTPLPPLPASISINPGLISSLPPRPTVRPAPLRVPCLVPAIS